MGIINKDPMTMKSGLNLDNCYLSFTPGPRAMPSPISFSWITDSTGKRTYFAYAGVYVYASAEKKAAGNDPIEVNQVSIPVDEQAVFSVLYNSLKNQYPNFKNEPDDAENQDSMSAPSSAPST